MAQKVDRVWRNCRLASLRGDGYGVVERAALAAADGGISWLGPESEMPGFKAAETVDLEGRWITPGLIDCHTHLVYAGNRAQEFEQRLGGATYEEISRAGGGIVSTVRATRAEAGGDKEAYIDNVCNEQLPTAARAGLVDAVDVFCEGIGFSNAQTRRVFDAAKALGIPVKLHAEQLSNLQGAALVAEFGGLSADHLEFVDEAGIQAMAAAGTVAVLLPGAFYFLRDTHVPPIDLMRKHGLAMAVATDCNPGSSPLTSILLAMNMACTLFQITPVEALAGLPATLPKPWEWRRKLARSRPVKPAIWRSGTSNIRRN